MKNEIHLCIKASSLPQRPCSATLPLRLHTILHCIFIILCIVYGFCDTLNMTAKLIYVKEGLRLIYASDCTACLIVEFVLTETKKFGIDFCHMFLGKPLNSHDWLP